MVLPALTGSRFHPPSSRKYIHSLKDPAALAWDDEVGTFGFQGQILNSYHRLPVHLGKVGS